MTRFQSFLGNHESERRSDYCAEVLGRRHSCSGAAIRIQIRRLPAAKYAVSRSTWAGNIHRRRASLRFPAPATVCDDNSPRTAVPLQRTASPSRKNSSSRLSGFSPSVPSFSASVDRHPSHRCRRHPRPDHLEFSRRLMYRSTTRWQIAPLSHSSRLCYGLGITVSVGQGL